MRHFVIDLETADTQPGALILSLAVVELNEDLTAEEDFLHVHLDAAEGAARGGTISPQTFLWWLQQEDTARLSVVEGQAPEATLGINHALMLVSAMIAGENPEAVPAKDAVVWAQGDSFDNVILAETYRRAGLKTPWAFYNNRDVRTLIDSTAVMLGARYTRNTPDVKHNALADARATAQDVIDCMAHLRNAVPRPLALGGGAGDDAQEA